MLIYSLWVSTLCHQHHILTNIWWETNFTDSQICMWVQMNILSCVQMMNNFLVKIHCNQSNTTSGKHDISRNVFISQHSPPSLSLPHTYVSKKKKEDVSLLLNTSHILQLLSGRSMTHRSALQRQEMPGLRLYPYDPCFIWRHNNARGALWKWKHILYFGRSLSDLRGQPERCGCMTNTSPETTSE